MRIEWRGLPETLAAIDALTEDFLDRTRSATVRYGVEAVVAMKENHDRDAHAIQRYVNRSWYLTHSIDYEIRPWSNEVLQLRIFTPAYYADWVESGTPRSRAYPFFWIEIYGRMPAAQESIYDAARAALRWHDGLVRAEIRRAA